MFHQFVTIDCPPLAEAATAEAALGWLRRPGATGRTLGLWRCEIGDLFRVVILRAFPDAAALEEDRLRRAREPTVFGVSGRDFAVRVETFRPFPFLPGIRIGARGGLYELRTYDLVPEGLPPTLAGWARAVPAAAAYTAHLVGAFFAAEGQSRIRHLWAFDSFEQRLALRRAHYRDGTWPPPGGPAQIRRARTALCVPIEGSPLH